MGIRATAHHVRGWGPGFCCGVGKGGWLPLGQEASLPLDTPSSGAGLVLRLEDRSLRAPGSTEQRHSARGTECGLAEPESAEPAPPVPPQKNQHWWAGLGTTAKAGGTARQAPGRAPEVCATEPSGRVSWSRRWHFS